MLITGCLDSCVVRIFLLLIPFICCSLWLTHLTVQSHFCKKVILQYILCGYVQDVTNMWTFLAKDFNYYIYSLFFRFTFSPSHTTMAHMFLLISIFFFFHISWYFIYIARNKNIIACLINFKNEDFINVWFKYTQESGFFFFFILFYYYY